MHSSTNRTETTSQIWHETSLVTRRRRASLTLYRYTRTYIIFYTYQRVYRLAQVESINQ